MIHCCRRAELCQHSSPWAQIWTVALSYGRKSLAVGISNEELHVCRALRLIKFWGVYNFFYFPDNPLIWARRSWEMSRERVEPGQKTGTASSQFHTLSISSLIPPIPRLEWEWRMSSPTHLCRGVLCCGKDVGGVIWADSLRHLCWHLFHTVMILHFFLPCVSTPTCSLKQRLCFLAVECNPRIRGH